MTLLLSAMTFFASAQNDTSQSRNEAVAEPVVLNEDIFVNTTAEAKEGGAKISWSMRCEQMESIQNVIVRYKRKVEKKKPYKYTEVIAPSALEYTLEELNQGDNYVWYVGVAKDGRDISTIMEDGEPDKEQMIWSSKGKESLRQTANGGFISYWNY
jgi:hypothetical protein